MTYLIKNSANISHPLKTHVSILEVAIQLLVLGHNENIPICQKTSISAFQNHLLLEIIVYFKVHKNSTSQSQKSYKNIF